jgi:hypothetical protein
MASKRRPLQLSSTHALNSARGLDRLEVLRRLSRANLIAALAGLVGLVLLLYLLSGNRLLLVAAVLIAGAGVEQLVRTHPASSARGLRETLFFLFVPCLFTLGVGVFFRYIWSGWLEVAAAIVSAALLGVVIFAEYHSVDASDDRFLTMRLLLNLAGYLAGFFLYTALYNQRLALPLAAFLVGLVSFSLGVEILREIELKTETLVVCAAALGFVMAQTRWALNFISLNGWLGGVFILVVFYVASQLLQSYFWDRFDRHAIAEYVSVGVVGTLFIVAGRILTHR